ncbi:putative Flp pilus-assembly TadE/G-like protein [Streptomyces sp. CG 926]|uniref:pilus assembly protein TadG-related protein n=1 Tax=Streptomyces sp. CG 926 TaxID=1882405 RepID=UPI000D6D9FB9|nr:pilus assembly protein TadG-related protein [Streptomyces sp. CG 926]PWK67771.1 putative Flp pilus-assembly TadE/G-like protein [Streptomyces sp. CG 926]
MGAARSRDEGQAFPIYVVAVTGLLFAAFAFVVVGMAGATRSDAQGAADAAVLAAAREVRDNAFDGINLLTLTQDDWEQIVTGDRLVGAGACAKADVFAGTNDATAVMCQANLPEFKVSVRTNGTVGDSVIPGSEGVHGTAEAKAVIEPRCSLKPAPSPSPSASPSPSPSPSVPPGGGGGAGTPPSVGFRCKGGATFTFDPTKPGSLTQLARKLFSVRLAD